jgi:hypothetical protein
MRLRRRSRNRALTFGGQHLCREIAGNLDKSVVLYWTGWMLGYWSALNATSPAGAQWVGEKLSDPSDGNKVALAVWQTCLTSPRLSLQEAVFQTCTTTLLNGQ